MKYLRGLFSAALALGVCNHSLAGTTIDYSIGGGGSSNIFRDTSGLSAGFADAKLGLRGSLDLEASHLTYALGVTGRRVEAYRFADRKTAGAEIGYAVDLSDAVRLALRVTAERREDGDIFLALPGAVVGYEKTDIAFSSGGGITIDHAGGKSHLTADVAKIGRGEARFTLPGVKPVRLEADTALLELAARHIRPVLGGEAGVTLQYRRNHVPERDQQAFARFPAETLRGSIAFGRRIGAGITLLAEIGLVHVDSPQLGAGVRTLRPFLKGEAAWEGPAGLRLSAKYGEDTRLADIDDAIGEHVRTIGGALEKTLTERLKLGLAYEQAFSDWLYYDYRTRTGTLSATLTFTLRGGSAVVLEYSRLVRREDDKAAGFEVDGLAARVTGSF